MPLTFLLNIQVHVKIYFLYEEVLYDFHFAPHRPFFT